MDKKIILIILGNSNVGKTTLIKRHIEEKFSGEKHQTIGNELYTLKENIDGENVNINLYDTAGQEKFDSLTESFMKQTQGVIFTFDVCSRKSFDKIDDWIKRMETNNGRFTSIIAGNKIDIEEREISTAEAQEFADLVRMPYIETSAKTGEGVGRLFDKIITQTYRSQKDLLSISKSFYLRKEKQKEMQKPKSKCCQS